MRFINALALSAPLVASLVAAVPNPHRKRDDGYVVTVTEEVVETVEVTTTVWVDAAPATPAAQATPNGEQLYENPNQYNNPGSSNQAPAYTPPAYTPPPVNTPPPAPYTPPAPAYTPPPPPPPPAYTPSPVQSPPPQSSSSSQPQGQVYSGDGTYYNPAGGYGSCGTLISDSDPVVAIAVGMMGSQSNGNPWCGQKIVIEWEGKQHEATVQDKCMGCEGQSIDLTADFFKTVCPDGDGRVHNLKWWKKTG